MTPHEELFLEEKHRLHIEPLKACVEKYLITCAERLIEEARHNAYSMMTRNLFILAVGAKSQLLAHPKYTPAYVNYAYEAISKSHGLLVVAGEDPELPFWTHEEWTTQVNQAYETVTTETGIVADRSVVGFLDILQQLIDE